MSEQPYRPRDRAPALDPAATLDMPDREWRRLVLSRIAETDVEIAENTAYTMDTRTDVAKIKADVDTLATRLAPVVVFTQQVQVGLKVIGWFGTGCEWILKKWMAIAITVVVGKLLLNGGTWEQAVKLWAELK